MSAGMGSNKAPADYDVMPDVARALLVFLGTVGNAGTLRGLLEVAGYRLTMGAMEALLQRMNEAGLVSLRRTGEPLPALVVEIMRAGAEVRDGLTSLDWIAGPEPRA